MSTPQIETASPVIAPVRPAFGRRVVDFTVETVAPVVAPAPVAPAPLRLTAREKEMVAAKAADDAAIAKAQAAAKASAVQAEVNERAANVPAKCSHASGCRTQAISRMMMWDRNGKPLCGRHAGHGAVTWKALQRRAEAEAEQSVAEMLRRIR